MMGLKNRGARLFYALLAIENLTASWKSPWEDHVTEEMFEEYQKKSRIFDAIGKGLDPLSIGLCLEYGLDYCYGPFWSGANHPQNWGFPDDKD